MAENSNRDKEKKYKSTETTGNNGKKPVRAKRSGGEHDKLDEKPKKNVDKNKKDLEKERAVDKPAKLGDRIGGGDSHDDAGSAKAKESAKTANDKEKKSGDELAEKETRKREVPKGGQSVKEAQSDKSTEKKSAPEWDELIKPQPAIEVNWYDQNPDVKAASEQAVKEFETRREERKNSAQKSHSKPPRSLWGQILTTVGIGKKRHRRAKKKPARPVEPSYRLEYNNRLKSSIAARAMAIQAPKSNRRGAWFIVFLAALLSLVLAGVWIMTRRDDNNGNKNTTSVNNKQREEEKTTDFDISYNKTIGFVGDSLTYGYETPTTRVQSPAPTDEVKLLGSDYRAINRGVNGSTTQDWQDDLLAPALKEFRDDNVEVVQVMLGTNDSAHMDLSIDDIMRYYRDIIGRLKDNGAKVIIINKVPYSPQHDDNRINQINLELNKLVDGDRVFLGDDKAYEYFRNHLELFVDGTHLTPDGYAELAKLWTAGFKRVLTGLDKNNSIKSNLSSDSYRLNSNDEFSYAIDRSPEWLTIADGSYAGIYIDGDKLNSDQYMITGGNGKTKINLSNTRLDDLSMGKHRIEVRYGDGIKFSDEVEVVE